jgi:hypothetical protein
MLLYKTLPRPVLRCEIESWTVRNSYYNRITVHEAKLMRRIIGSTKRDPIGIEGILKEFKIEAVTVDHTKHYR